MLGFKLPCFGLPAIKILSFISLHIDCSVQAIFVSNTVSLRSKLCFVLLMQWVIGVRQARLLDPHWGANLLSVALKPCMLSKCHHWWKQQLLVQAPSEEWKHNTKLLTVKKGSEILQYLMTYTLTYTRRLEEWKIDVITSETALCCLKYSSVFDYHIKLLVLFTKENQTSDHTITEPETFSHFSGLIFQMV